VSGSETAGETPVSPWLVDVIVGIVAARIVADPVVALHIYVRSVGVSVSFVIMSRFVACRRRRCVCHGCGTSRRNVAPANLWSSATALLFLCKHRDQQEQGCRE
jgi:hypothetical protein